MMPQHFMMTSATQREFQIKRSTCDPVKHSYVILDAESFAQYFDARSR